MNSLPDAIDTDGDDVIWALQTANTLWKRGEVNEALVWVKRAAKAADEAGDALRAMDLQHALQQLEQARAQAVSSPDVAAETDVPESAAAMLSLATTQVSANGSPPATPQAEGGAAVPPASAPLAEEPIEVDSSALASVAPAPPAAKSGPVVPVPPAPPPRPEQRTDPLFTPAFGARGKTSPSIPPPSSSDLLEEITDSDVELAPDSLVDPKPTPQAPGPPPPRKASPTIAPGRPPHPPPHTHPLATTQPSPGAAPPGPPPPRPPAPTRAPQADPHAPPGALSPAIPPPARLPSARDAALPPPRPRMASLPPPDREPTAPGTSDEAPDATSATGPVVAAPPPAEGSSPRPRSAPPPAGSPAPPPPPRPIAETRVDSPLAQARVDSLAPIAINPAITSLDAVPASSAEPPPTVADTRPQSAPSFAPSSATTGGELAPVPPPPRAPASPAPPTEAPRPREIAATVPELENTPPLTFPLPSVMPVPITSMQPAAAVVPPASKVPTIPPPSAPEEVVEVDVEVEAPSIERPRRMPRPLTGLLLLNPWALTDHVISSAPDLDFLTDAERESSLPPEPLSLGSLDARLRPSAQPDALPLSDDEIIGDGEMAAARADELLAADAKPVSTPEALGARTAAAPAPAPRPRAASAVPAAPARQQAQATEANAPSAPRAPQASRSVAPATAHGPSAPSARPGSAPSLGASVPRPPRAPSIAAPKPEVIPPIATEQATENTQVSSRAPAGAGADAAPPIVDVEAPRVTPPEPVASRRTHPPPKTADQLASNEVAPTASPTPATPPTTTTASPAPSPSSALLPPVDAVPRPPAAAPRPRSTPPAAAAPLPEPLPSTSPPATAERLPSTRPPATVERLPSTSPPATAERLPSTSPPPLSEPLPATSPPPPSEPLPATTPPPPASAPPPPPAPAAEVPAAAAASEPARSSAAPVSSGPNSAAPAILTGNEPFGPLILDSVSAFADLPRDIRRKFANEGRVLELGVGDGTGDFALAYIHRGRVDITAVVHDTPVMSLERGTVLRSRATIEPSPPVRLVGSAEDSLVVLWDDTAFSEAFQACTWVEDDLRREATRPLALVGAITGALSDRLDERHMRELLASLELRVLGPNETLVEQGGNVEGVALVGCGELRRVRTDHEPETVPTGAFILADEVLSASRAKATVIAGDGGAAVFVLDRKKTQELVMTYPPVLEILAGM